MSGGTALDACLIADQLLAIERSLDLEHPDWLKDEVHLWPMYRLELYRLLFVAQAGPSTNHPSRPNIGPALKCLEASSRDAAQACQVWLVSDGISFATMGDVQVERFCGPLHDALRGLGIPSVLIDRGSPDRRESTTPTRWWTPMTVRAKIWGTMRAVLRPDGRHARLIRQVGLIAERAGINLPPISARRLDAMTHAILSLSGKLASRMKRERVRTVFVVSYYDVGGYAYVLAARRSGAMCVDVQHGVTGTLHMAYADWAMEPSSGLTLLPDHFWCWAPEDARIIEQWAHRHRRTVYRAFVGGHPFIEAWRTGALQLDDQAQCVLGQMRQKAQGQPIVLVTFQPHLTSVESLGPLLEAWRLQPQVTWWLRLHPLAASDRPQIEAMLASHGVTSWNINGASSLPLPVLLKESSLHATHSSSTVIEAELLGVPSVIWSAYGAQIFEDHIRKGVASHVVDGASLTRVISGLRNAHAARAPVAATSAMSQTLQALFKTAP